MRPGWICLACKREDSLKKRQRRQEPQEEYSYEQLREEREYGLFWYSWLWNILRPILVILCVTVIVVGIFATGWHFISARYVDPVDASSTAAVTFEVKSGSSLTRVANNLEAAGLVRNRSVFKYYADFLGYGQKIQAGTYTLSPSMTLREIAEQLTRGDGTPLVRKITIIEGWTVQSIAAYLKREGVISDEEQFLSLCRTGEQFSAYYYIADVRASANFSQRIYALEGYLSPNTYEIYTSATPEEIIKKLLSQTEAVFRDEWHDRADALGMTMDQVITLASLIEKEAKKLGLVVSKAEIQAIINAGVHPMLQQTPFRNPQTGAFDKDMLKKFLVDYSKMNKAQMPSQYAEYYESMYKFWSFLEKSLIQARLQEKYQALITKSLFSNPVEAQDAFDARVEQSDLLLAAVPYSSIVDSTIVIKDSDLKAAYDKKKEQFKQYVETRNIKFIDVQVTASAEDRAALQKEMEEYTEQLTANPSDYTTFIRSTGSEAPYTDLFYTTKSLPADVTARLDSVAVGGVFGPYYNVSDNTLNSFKKLATAAMPDSIEFRQIQVVAEDAEKTKTLADSIYNAIKGGASFAEIAKKYGQTGEPTWISSANYEGAQIDGDNLKYITAVTTLGQNELTNLALGQANVILQVTNKKAVKDKYKVAVIKRPVEFSKETYSKAYNEFSQFIAANNTLEKMIANAEDAGYKLLDRADLYSSEHGIGGIRGTKDALKWAFEAKAGEVSGLYECGESDRMLVVGVASIVPEGYRPLALVKDQLRAEILRDKKAEKIMADMKAANATSFEQYKNMANAVSDSVKHVTFSAPAYIPALRSSEPLVGAYASIAEVNKLSAPIKGNGGVFVLQPYAKEKLNETFNKETEEANLANMHARMASQFISDLYLKANVKDQRYLFF